MHNKLPARYASFFFFLFKERRGGSRSFPARSIAKVRPTADVPRFIFFLLNSAPSREKAGAKSATLTAPTAARSNSYPTVAEGVRKLASRLHQIARAHLHSFLFARARAWVVWYKDCTTSSEKALDDQTGGLSLRPAGEVSDLDR